MLRPVRAAGLFIALLPALVGLAQEVEPRPAEPARLAHRGLVLDAVATPARFVAVGERGHVLLSPDGEQWRQAESVPVRATLTRVAGVDDRLWAVGHDSTIIHSDDGGETWTLQHFEPDWEQPLLDVHFFDRQRGLAVGAYSLYLHTDDGGESWQRAGFNERMTSEAIDWEQTAEEAETFDDQLSTDAETDNPWGDSLYDASQDFDRGCYEFMECHFNALLAPGNGRLMMAAERGYGFRSSDGGETWESFRFPYPGSMFGLLDLGGDRVLAFGLRGNVQLSEDFGSNWEVLDSGTDSSLMDGALDRRDRAVMVGAGAAIVRYDPDSGQFRLSEDRLGNDYAAVMVSDDGRLVIAGEGGVRIE